MNAAEATIVAATIALQRTTAVAVAMDSGMRFLDFPARDGGRHRPHK